MSRSLPSAFTGSMGDLDPQPRVLVEIATGLTGANAFIRITNADADVSWPTSGGATYTSRPMQISDARIDGGDHEGITFRLADADDYFATWLLSTNFRHQKVRRWLVSLGSTATSAHAILDVYRVESRERTPHEVVFSAKPAQGILSQLKLPRRTMTRSDFPGLPREGLVR